MDNASEPAPNSSPRPSSSRSTPASRKPQPQSKAPTKRATPANTTAKPAVKPIAKPVAKPVVKPVARQTAKPGVKPASAAAAQAGSRTATTKQPVEPELLVEHELPTEPEQPAGADSVPSGHLTVTRLSVDRLTVPPLSSVRQSRGAAAAAGHEAEAETESDHEDELEREAAPEAEADSTPDAEPDPQAEVEPDAQPQPELIAVAESAEDPALESDADAPILRVRGLSKSFGDTIAVSDLDLVVPAGSFYGIVGPNGAGKTTTLSMITGLLRPDSGTVAVHGADVWTDPAVAKRNMGVLPDRLRLFDRLTGSQVLYYAGILRGLDAATVRKRTTDLARVFGLEEALGRLVTDYSAGMTKKIALAAAMIHSPRLLVLDEPFESVDPVSSATVTEILRSYVEYGGTVVLSSHSMDLVQRICDHVAVIVGGVILADGPMSVVRNGRTLEERFIELAGGRKTVEGLEWLHSFSD